MLDSTDPKSDSQSHTGTTCRHSSSRSNRDSARCSRLQAWHRQTTSSHPAGHVRPDTLSAATTDSFRRKPSDSHFLRWWHADPRAPIPRGSSPGPHARPGRMLRRHQQLGATNPRTKSIGYWRGQGPWQEPSLHRACGRIGVPGRLRSLHCFDMCDRGGSNVLSFGFGLFDLTGQAHLAPRQTAFAVFCRPGTLLDTALEQKGDSPKRLPGPPVGPVVVEILHEDGNAAGKAGDDRHCTSHQHRQKVRVQESAASDHCDFVDLGCHTKHRHPLRALEQSGITPIQP